MITQADIDFMKTTWMAFGGWTKEQQEWAIKSWPEFTIGYCFEYKKLDKVFEYNFCYRLRSDYVLPEEKWWFCNEGQKLHQSKVAAMVCCECIEIHGTMLEYVRECLKRKDIGEFELRIVKKGDCFISPLHYYEEEEHTDSDTLCFCRRKPVSRFVEYPIFVNKNMTFGYRVNVKHLNNSVSEIPLHKVSSVVGFAGVKFNGQNNDVWHMFTSALIDENGNISSFSYDVPLKPAIPILARFYVEAGQ